MANAANTNSNANANVVLDTKIKGIRVYSDSSDYIKYRVTFADVFDGIVKDDNGDYVEKSIDYIDFVPRYFIAIALDNIEGLSIMYDKKQEALLRGIGSGFGIAELNVVLRGASVRLTRTHFNVGDEYTDKDGETHAHEHAGYDTELSKFTVVDAVRRHLDAMFDKVFEI